MKRSALISIAAFVVGAALAALGIALAPKADPVEETVATTLPPVAAAAPGAWWFSPAETLVGPTAILLEDLQFEDGEVVVRYELRDIAPPALGRLRQAGEINPFFAPPREDPIAAPENWVLETIDGEFPGSSASARVRTARFEVPDDFVMGTITGLRVESYRMRMPYVYVVETQPLAGTTVTLDDDFTFTIDAVLQQSNSVIFQIHTTTPSDSFTAGEAVPAIVRGVGSEWDSFAAQQIVLGTPDIPDPFLLEVRTTYWVPFETSVPVDLGGLVG